MEKFQPNTRFYSKNYNSFSSKDEFDSAKRVQITNEIPPMDMFDYTHSMLTNSLWKWFLGYSLVMNDMVYNEDTDGVETIDNEGNIGNLTIAKYVNGVRAKDYGPIPEKKWNPNYKKDYKEYLEYIKDDTHLEDRLTEDNFKYSIDYSKKARRIEINGVLLPEVDLMLHEAYRYLSVLYPDHPDFMELLTTNEFEDDIAQAASIIDYVPDQVFFNWLATKFDYSSIVEDHIEDAKIEEAAKLKIRNLLNHSMRRKFFGSKTGYKMMGSDIFQHVAVFPAAQVIPYKEYSDTRTEEEIQNPYSVDFKWLRAFENIPDNFKTAEREINKSHVLYKKRVRLLDWTNETYKFPERWIEPAKFYGTAWPTPYSQFVLYEYPLQKVIDEKDYDELKDGLSTTRTIKNDFKVGQRIKIGGQDNNWTDYQVGHIASIREDATYSVELNLYSENNGETVVHENPNTLTVVDVDVPVNPFYMNFEVWPSNKELLSKIAEYERVVHYCKEEGLINKYEDRIKKSLFSKKTRFNKYTEFCSVNSFKDSTEELHNIVYDPAVQKLFNKENIECRQMNIGKFTPDPHQDGCMYMSPEQFMTTFEDELNIKLNTSPWNNYTEETFYDENDTPVEWPISEIEYGVTNMAPNGFVQKGDILKYQDDEKLFESQVLGISNAFIQFKIDESTSSLEDLKVKIQEAKEAETSRYGLVMELSENNVEGANKKVVLYGNPVYGEPTEIDAHRHYAPSSIYFNIKAIPRVKSHMAMRAIYGDEFTKACEEKYKALELLLGTNGKNAIYFTVKEDLDRFDEPYAEFRFLCKNYVSVLTDNKLLYEDKNIQDKQNALDKAYESLLSNFKNLINALSSGKLLYNDLTWKSLKEAANVYLKLFETDSTLFYEGISSVYNEWLDKYNTSVEKLISVEKLKSSIDELCNIFEKYNMYYSKQIKETLICKKLKDTLSTFVSLFETNRPILHKQILFLCTDWLNKFVKLLDSTEKYESPLAEEIQDLLYKMYSTCEEYYKEYYSWQIEEAAIDISRDYYLEELTKDYGSMSDKKLAVAGIIECDKKLFEEMLPNRAFLISPLPKDIFMEQLPTENSSYTLLTGQDKFVSIIEFEKNKYDDMIDQKLQPIFGKSGLLQNCMNYSCDAWNFGALNTVTVVETHFNSDKYEYESADVVDNKDKIDFLDDYYHSSLNYLEKYNELFPENTQLHLDNEGVHLTQEEYDALEDEHYKEEHLHLNEEDGQYYSEKTVITYLPYMHINDGIQNVFDNDDNSHKFAYGDPNMMEMFLEDN